MSSSSGFSNGPPPRTSSRMGPYYHKKTAGRKNHRGGRAPMMDITVTVLNLTGIIMHAKKGKDGMKENVMKSTMSASNLIIDSIPKQGTNEISMPVAVLASFYKNVANSETSIASHMASLPLRAPSPDIDNEKYQHTATWPTDFDPSGNELSAFKCSRLTKKGPTREYDRREDSVSSVMGIIPEKIQLKIGLRQGSEIITLGSAVILITGEESDDIIVSLPINTAKIEEQEIFGGKLKKSRSKIFGKSSTKKKKLKPVSFTKGPRRKYVLDDNSSLNVLIRVAPSHHNLKLQTYPTSDYNSPPEVLHVSAESNNSGEPSSNTNFTTRRSRSVNRCMNRSEEDYQFVDGGHARSREKKTLCRREPRHILRSGSESRRIIRSGSRSATHSEPDIQYSGERSLRSCDNNINPREIGEARSYENTDLNPKVGDHQSSYDRYEPHYDDLDNIYDEPVVEFPHPECDFETNLTHAGQTQDVDEIKTRRSVDKAEANLKQGSKSRSRSNAGLRAKPAINRISPDQKSSADNPGGLFCSSSSIFRCGDTIGVLSENERKVHTKEIQSDEDHMQYEENTMSVLSKNEREVHAKEVQSDEDHTQYEEHTMSVLSENEREVHTKEVQSDEDHMQYEEELTPTDLFENDSDGDNCTIGMSYENTGKSHSLIVNDSVFETYYPGGTQMLDEYATGPTRNKHQGPKIMREDQAMNMIHNYFNRVGVHPTTMV